MSCEKGLKPFSPIQRKVKAGSKNPIHKWEMLFSGHYSVSLWRCARVELIQVFRTVNIRGGLEEKKFHIVFFRGSFLAERGPRGISTCYSGYSSFWRSSDDEIASNGCFWISNVDYDRYAIPRDIHEETARSA